MDNRDFNVKGTTKQQLALAISLLLLDEYGKKNKVRGAYFSKKRGLVLVSYIGDKSEAKKFTDNLGNPMEEISEADLVDVLFKWKDSEQAKEVELGDWDHDQEDSDISTELGWRLFCDEWGHVRNEYGSIDHSSIAAFIPSYCWYGK